MKKTLLASAIALSLGSVASVQAQTITVTQMSFGGLHNATGTLNSDGNGQIQKADNLGSFPFWTVDQQNWFDTHSNTLTWSGTGTQSNTSNAIADFTYTFQLSSNQVAVGSFFDWAGHINLPILTIYECPVSGGGVCKGVSLGMPSGPFPGSAPDFNGTTTNDFPISGVPVPAALWLMGSGLIGLVSVARRKRLQPHQR